MKNIHILPTEKPSRLIKNSKSNKLFLVIKPLSEKNDIYTKQIIYITDNSEIKEGDWCLSKLNELVIFKGKNFNYKKIILTTDHDLIKNGVQPISDEFLDWFVDKAADSGKPIDTIEVEKTGGRYSYDMGGNVWIPVEYKIIFPKETLKKNIEKLPFPSLVDQLAQYYNTLSIVETPEESTTLEEAAKNYSENWEKITGLNYENEYPSVVNKLDFTNGAKWQAKRSFTPEEVLQCISDWDEYQWNENSFNGKDRLSLKEWFEKFKKK
jgi:hypothetical protein